MQQAEGLERLQRVVGPLIPAELRDHVTLAGVRDGCLLLITDSGVWASRLRQLQHSLLGQLASRLPELKVQSVGIKVRPRAGQRKNTRKALRISKENARLLEEEAGQTKDEGLKRVLQSLASRTRDAD